MQATLAQVLMEVRELKTLKYSHDSKPHKAISGEHQPPFISYHHQGQPSVPQAAQTALSNLGNSYTGDLGYAEGRTSGVGVWGTWGGSSAVREGVRGRGLQGNRGGGIRGDRRRLRQGGQNVSSWIPTPQNIGLGPGPLDPGLHRPCRPSLRF